MELVRATDDTFCIAVLGDFLGEGDRHAGTESSGFVPYRATPDSVMKLVGLRPRIRAILGHGGGTAEVEFTSLEDFDPGSLFQKLDLFGPLREAREDAKAGRPQKPSAPGPLAQEGQPESGGADRPSDDVPGPEGGAGLLDAILEISEPAGEAPESGSPEEIEAFVRAVVRPHLVRDDSDIKAGVAAVDREISLRMSELIHTTAFQELEAIWRSVVFLLSRVDTTGKVRVYLVHLPKDELAHDLDASTDLGGSKLYDLLSNPQLGAPGRRWGVVVGAHRFTQDSEDIELLGRISRVAQAADVPWISEMTPSAGGESQTPGIANGPWLEEPPDDWMALCGTPAAAWLGLTYPPFLLREPYGTGSRRAKGISLMEETTSVEDLLWGPGPFLPAALMAQGFVSEGWGVRLGNHLDLGGLPLCEVPGQAGGTPVSLRVGLRPSDARSLMEIGLIPILGFPDLAGVRVGGFFSVGGPERALMGWWRG